MRYSRIQGSRIALAIICSVSLAACSPLDHRRRQRDREFNLGYGSDLYDTGDTFRLEQRDSFATGFGRSRDLSLIHEIDELEYELNETKRRAEHNRDHEAAYRYRSWILESRKLRHEAERLENLRQAHSFDSPIVRQREKLLYNKLAKLKQEIADDRFRRY